MQSFLHRFEASIVNAPDYYDFSLSFAGFTFSHICFKADDRLYFDFLYVFFLFVFLFTDEDDTSVSTPPAG